MTGRASRLKALAAFVVAWMGISAGVVVFLEDGEARILAPLLGGLTAAIALWHPVPRAGAATAVLAAGVFAAIRYLIDGPEGLAGPALAAVVALIGTGLLADVLAERAEADALQRRHDSLLIEELTPTSANGAMKWQHAQKELADEVARGRRYKYPVSLVLISLDPLLDSAEDEAAQTAVRQRSELVRFMLKKTRTSDHVSFRGDDQVTLVLPHTPLKGALMFLDKNLPDIKEATGLDPRMSVAEFPTDAGSPEELIAEAEAALEFGRASDVRIVSRAFLMARPEGPAASAPATEGR